MRVFSSVGVGVGVVVLDMFVLVAGVRVRVSNFVVAVFVGVRFVVTVFMVCHCRLLWCEIPAVSIVLSAMSPGNKRGHPVWSATLAARWVYNSAHGLRCQGSGTTR